MADPRIENGRIAGTMLGVEGHGCLTCCLFIDFDTSSQGFGQHSLHYKYYGLRYIERILEVVGVAKWEDLKGRYLRAKRDFTQIHAIGNIIKDDWFDPQEDARIAQEKEESDASKDPVHD